jgi:hypothetical protein
MSRKVDAESVLSSPDYEPTDPSPDSLMDFDNAFYIKLGAGGRWAVDSIENQRLRLGWAGIPLADVHAKRWDHIRELLSREHTHKSTISADTQRLHDLAESGPNDVWITFHNSRLYWGRLDDSPMEEDGESKFRRLVAPWRDTDAKNRLLLANQIPGRIAQLQGFRGTVCRVAEREALRRLLAGIASPEFDALDAARVSLTRATEAAIRQLHWKDFEILVDLVFRQAGWRRRTVLGKAMKYADIELEAPITREAFQVQVKSRADLGEFRKYVEQFDGVGFHGLYFVVHSPETDLAAAEPPEGVELVLPSRLAELVVDHGLTGWLSDKVR